MTKGQEVRVAVDVRCLLGEGPIWHPERGRLLWFDILRQVVYEADGGGGGLVAIGFGEAVSAAGLIDERSVAVAAASGLYRLDLESGERALIAPLEAKNASTRSNDGRVGPGGAFWIGTMGWGIEADAGGLYRFANGVFTTVKAHSTCPNALCFSPDGTRAYFSETYDHRIVYFPLDPADGTPNGPPELFVDLSDKGYCPDGAVVDAEGRLWSAHVGAGRVVCYSPDGRAEQQITLPVTLPTCPAFGGPNHETLFITTATVGLSAAELAEQPLAGAVFAVDVDVPGLPEHRLSLGPE